MSSKEPELVQRAKRDPSAFGELYDQYVDRIYNYVLHRVGDVGDAEDLTSRVFQRALVKMPGYEDRGAPFGAWLYRIAHNLIANWYRDTGRYQKVAFEELEAESERLTSAASGVDRLAEQVLVGERMSRAVGRLDADRQTLLILKFNQGLSNAEIAAVLGRSEGAVKSLYHRTLLALREQLDASGPHDDGAGPSER